MQGTGGSPAFQLHCLSCGRAARAGTSACAGCGGVLTVEYDLDGLRRREDWLHADRGLLRYRALLPLDAPERAVTLGAGGTPLVRSANLARRLGLRSLYYKVEGVNPTGSYKDRAAAVGISRARELGKRAWAATSSGNAGAALAALGAHASLPGTLVVLEGAPRAKIAQILAYGPRVVAVRGLGRDPAVERQTFANIRRLCAERDWMLLVTARSLSPEAMEGVKTIAYEVCEQLGDRAPDRVYVPVGGGGLLSTNWKGYAEWRAVDRVSSLPKMVACQGEGCAPVVDAWRAGHECRPIPRCEGSISGLQLAAPPDGQLALDAVRESGGRAVAVPDAETYRAQALLAREEGLFVEPAAAIGVAALAREVEAGLVGPDETVVCYLTGVGFKDQRAAQALAEGVEIPTIDVAELTGLDAGERGAQA